MTMATMVAPSGLRFLDFLLCRVTSLFIPSQSTFGLSWRLASHSCPSFCASFLSDSWRVPCSSYWTTMFLAFMLSLPFCLIFTCWMVWFFSVVVAFSIHRRSLWSSDRLRVLSSVLVRRDMVPLVALRLMSEPLVSSAAVIEMFCSLEVMLRAPVEVRVVAIVFVKLLCSE